MIAMMMMMEKGKIKKERDDKDDDVGDVVAGSDNDLTLEDQHCRLNEVELCSIFVLLSFFFSAFLLIHLLVLLTSAT